MNPPSPRSFGRAPLWTAAAATAVLFPLTTATPAQAAEVSPGAGSVLDDEAIFFVSYDGLVNNASYQQDAILTHGDHQYAAWYTDDRSPVLARRALDEDGSPGSWETLSLPHSLSEDNSHNTVSLGISAEDGRIHAVMDAHSSTLHYFVSEEGLADSPGTSWAAEAFGDLQRDLGGLDLGTMTYPRFAATPSGNLQLSYRSGVSGNGQAEIAEYSDGSWSRLGAWSSSEGTYSENGGTSDSRNLYLHGFDYDGSGRLHASFTWREGSEDITCGPGNLANHDTGYVYSDDEGRTWRTDDGEVAAETGTGDLLSVDTPGHVVDPLPGDHGLINQESQAVDSRGNPHVVISYVPGRAMECLDDYADDRREHGQVFHLHRDTSGEWHKTELPEPLDSFGRSQVVVDAEDRAHVVMPEGRVVSADPGDGWRDWSLTHDGSAVGSYGEVLVDDDRLLEDGTFSVLHQDPSSGTEPSPIRVTDFSVD